MSDLFNKVTSATGLPPEVITKELGEIITHAGIEREALNIENLRQAMMQYLTEIACTFANEFAEETESR